MSQPYCRGPERLVGTTGMSTFRVAPEHTTTVFGKQDIPPGRPAAADATTEETVSVLGTDICSPVWSSRAVSRSTARYRPEWASWVSA